MLEHVLAAEVLEVRVLDPPRAQHLVRKRMHVLEDEEPRHQPRRQRRLAVARRVDLAEPTLQKAPVDLPRQANERVAHVDDRLQRRPEQVRLPVFPRSCHFRSPDAE